MQPPKDTIPYGFCHCGCGEITKIAIRTESRMGWFKGEPRRYVNGHWRRKSPVPFIVKDCGHETECHLWARYITRDGYGQIGRNGKIIPAHKFYYEEKNGPVPDGLELDHLCRIRSCVNPDHLEPVTDAINSQRGCKTKLTAEKASAIRAFDRSIPAVEVGRIFGISKSQIVKIRRNATWKETV